LTVEEPQTTDAESASTPEDAGTKTQSATETSEAATEATAVEAEPVAEPASGDVAPVADAQDDTEAQDDTSETAAVSEETAPESVSGDGSSDDPADGSGADDATAETAATADETAATADETAATADETAHAAQEPPAPEPEPTPPVDLGPEPTTMEELLAEQPGDIPSLKHGDVVEGKIVRIDKDEMLVDVGAKSEGVVSNRELYGRNAESQPDLNVGDTVLVYVLQPESADGHAVLSLRRAGLERKWRSMQEQFDEGEIIEAPVIDHNKGGLIVDCGIRGFVPISQIVDFPRRPQNDQPRDAAQEIAEKLQPYVGRKLRLKILEVNRKANRLILSEKVALYEERREKRDELFSSLETGQKVTGTVRSIAPFGIFVDLGGIDGLVHKSELSWNKVNTPEGAYEVGDEVEAEVIDINHERGRISLSIRRLLPDPWQSTVADLKVGDIVDGTVTKIVNFGAFVRVKDGLEGLIHISELSHQRVAHPGDVVHEGQTLKLKIISLDSERHRLGLSLKQAEEAPARPARERRPRERGGFDRSQAVQEPEGGIDNTLAAAFAQVRQQIAEQDAASADDVEVAAEAVEAEAIAGAVEAEAVAEAAEEVEAEALADEVLDLEGAADAEEVAEAAEDIKVAAEDEVIEDLEEAAAATTPEAEAVALEQAAEAGEIAEAAEIVEADALAEEAADLEGAAEAEMVAEVAEEVEAEAEAEVVADLETAAEAEVVAEAAADVKADAEADAADAHEEAAKD
jgi:small subunit ribosomal protein S1